MKIYYQVQFKFFHRNAWQGLGNYNNLDAARIAAEEWKRTRNKDHKGEVSTTLNLTQIRKITIETVV